ncbi:MAG: helix-turn-helix domain-containing protein [Hymenobacter sp.]
MTKLEQQQHIQQRLQALLHKKRLSQNELARLADVSAANISHILNEAGR